ncbi:MAG: hypothetical protein L3K10_02840 [Thermoplasmata archaeon]|nr:hypothetical protein [Thermoplasmata archaeon]
MAPVTSINPTVGLGWSIQGVPQSRGYIDFALTWDPFDNYVLLFGGSNITGDYMADTWTYHEGAWTELFPASTPIGRDSSGLAYDPADQSMVLFGGYTPDTAYSLNDTWLFRGGVWTEIPTGNGPSPRYGFGFVYDPNTFSDVLFGGYSPLCPAVSGNICNDTWSWSFGSWAHDRPATSPVARYEQSMSFDTADGYLVMFGGYGGSGCLQPSGYCQDTWTYDGSTWSQVATGGTPCGNNVTGNCTASAAPGPRTEGAFAYDPPDGYAVLFGGTNQSVGTMSDTWKYSAGAWTRLAPTTTPWSRFGAGLTFDGSAGDGYLFLYGGQYEGETPPDVFWGFQSGNWTEVQQPANLPPNSYGSSMVFDAADGYVLFLGGFGSVGYVNETWAYRSGTWTHLAESVAPRARLWTSMAWDPASDYVLLFGGNSFGFVNDTWEFSGGHWTQLCTGGPVTCGPYSTYAPSPREGASLAYDHSSQTMVLFGGYTGSRYLNETWDWFGNYWSNYTSFELGFPQHPSARAFSGFVNDVRDGEDVLFGGANHSGAYGDTWVLTSLYSGWSQVGSCGGPGQLACSGSTPSSRSSFSMVYDSAEQVVLVTGGTTGPFGGGLRGGTYGFQGGTWYSCPAYSCNYYFGLAPLPLFPASAFDPIDGYTILRGGLEAYGITSYEGKADWILGPFLSSAGPTVFPQYIDVGQAVQFNVGASGGGTGTYSYEWNGLPQGCAPAFSGASSISCSPQGPGFTFYYNYVVGYDFFAGPSVVVHASNGFPEITSGQLEWLYVARDTIAILNGSASSADVGQTVYYAVTASNGWGPYRFALQGAPPGCVVAQSSLAQVLFSCLLTPSDLGVWSVLGSATDNAAYSALSPASTLVVSAAPGSSGVTVNTATLDAGQMLSVGVSPSGGQGPYSFAWSGVPAACNANSALLSCAVPATETGTYVPSVTIRDSNGGIVAKSYSGSVVVSAAPAASALTIDTPANSPTLAIDAGKSVTFHVVSTPGSGGDTVAWQGLPSGCTASVPTASNVTCAPNTPGSYAPTATVTDSNGGSATTPATTFLVSPALGRATVGTSAGTLDVGQTLTLGADILGGSGGYSYAWTGLPTGCEAVNSPTIVCTPSATDPAQVSVVVTDSNGGSSTGTTSVTVNPALQVALTDQVTASTAPGAAAFTATATGGTTPLTYAWTVNGATQSGATGNTLQLSGLGSGSVSVQVRVSDGAGVSTSSSTASVTVAAAASSSTSTSSSSSTLQYLELALLAVLLVLVVVAIVVGRRRPPPPEVIVSPASPAGPPPPAPVPPPGATQSGDPPPWNEG